MNKQLICHDTASFKFEEEAIPEAPDKGLVIKIYFTGICHSDANLFFNQKTKVLLPRIYGHEISGTVHKIGKDCTEGKLLIGDRVVVYPWCGCRKCDNCLAGDNNICTYRETPEAEVYGVWRHGGYQEYVQINDTWPVVRVPDDIPLDVASLVPCSGITAYNAVEQCKESLKRAVGASGHANMLIVGAGGLGLWAIQIAKSVYQDTVIVVAADINEAKLEEAKKSGANDTVLLPKEGEASAVAETIKACFDWKGVDAAIDFVNITVTFERIFHSLRAGATTVMVGLSAAQMPQVKMTPFILKSIRVQGIYTAQRERIQDVFKLLLEKKIKGPKIDYMKLEDVKSVFQKMATGTLVSGRAVVNMRMGKH